MPPPRSLPVGKNLNLKTERTHEENQERAYIAASRRTDRSLEARVESARRASEIHKRRTGRGLRVTEEDVLNDEMYEEEDDDLPLPYRQLTHHLTTGSTEFNRRLAAYLTNHVAVRSALAGILRDSHNLSANGPADVSGIDSSRFSSTMYPSPFIMDSGGGGGGGGNSFGMAASTANSSASAREEMKATSTLSPGSQASPHPPFHSRPRAMSSTSALQDVELHRPSPLPTRRFSDTQFLGDDSPGSFRKPDSRRKLEKITSKDRPSTASDDKISNYRKRQISPDSPLRNEVDESGEQPDSKRGRIAKHRRTSYHPHPHSEQDSKSNISTPSTMSDQYNSPIVPSSSSLGFFNLSLPGNAQDLLYGGFDMADPLAGPLMGTIDPSKAMYISPYEQGYQMSRLSAVPATQSPADPSPSATDVAHQASFPFDMKHVDDDYHLDSLTSATATGKLDAMWGDFLAGDTFTNEEATH